LAAHAAKTMHQLSPKERKAYGAAALVGALGTIVALIAVSLVLVPIAIASAAELDDSDQKVKDKRSNILGCLSGVMVAAALSGVIASVVLAYTEKDIRKAISKRIHTQQQWQATQRHKFQQ
jgi:mannitol-specific phosphotransferase system IIBC component